MSSPNAYSYFCNLRGNVIVAEYYNKFIFPQTHGLDRVATGIGAYLSMSSGNGQEALLFLQSNCIPAAYGQEQLLICS
jgi:hypothetical protein